MKRFLRIFGVLSALVGAHPAFSQNQVYDPLPPPGSAYIRFVNITDGALTLRPNFAVAQQLGIKDADRITPFYPVEKVASRSLQVEAVSTQLNGKVSIKADAGSYVTVFVKADANKGLSAVAVVDQTEYNQSRARLAFYNATADCGSALLKLDDGPIVFQDVGPGTSKARSVNPVTANIHAACSDKTTSSFPLEGLEAGGTYSIWMLDTGVTISAFLSRDKTAKYVP